MKQGKNFRCFGTRQSLIGDCLYSLPVLNWLELQYPNSYKYFHIAKKCAQAADLFLGQDLIDKIVISDCEEGFGIKDIEIMKSCDLVLNTMPRHPLGERWHPFRNMTEETFIMAGFSLENFYSMPEEMRIPTLYKWFNTEKLEKTIAIHCFAGYGRDNQRSPSVEWWENLIIKLYHDYRIIRLGHPNEPDFYLSDVCLAGDCREDSFIEQIQAALSCSLYIGTDSGFSLAMGAYSHPQISLITNWNVGHTENPLCLQPINKNNISLFNEFKSGGCSGIPQEKVLDSIKLLI